MRPLTSDEIICLCGLASVLAVAIYAHWQDQKRKRADALQRELEDLYAAIEQDDRRMDELARKMLAEVDLEELAKRPGSWPL
jgi:dihydrodipicolinate synthase/N-acetylneuraminate lyase